MNDPIIGCIQFTDGCKRDIYQTSDCRQYVVDDAGDQVFGVWIMERDDDGDLPIVVPAARR